MVWGLPGLFKQHPPKVWGLPALSKRHPTKTWRPMVATTGAEWLGRPLSNPLRQVWATTLKNHNLIHFFTEAPAAGFCLFKRDPPRGLPRLSETLRGFLGWPVATPRAEVPPLRPGEPPHPSRAESLFTFYIPFSLPAPPSPPTPYHHRHCDPFCCLFAVPDLPKPRKSSQNCVKNRPGSLPGKTLTFRRRTS